MKYLVTFGTDEVDILAVPTGNVADVEDAMADATAQVRRLFGRDSVTASLPITTATQL